MQATDDNMMCAHCMLGNCGYKYTLRLCNSYCFSTASVVVYMFLSVPLYICIVCFVNINSVRMCGVASFSQLIGWLLLRVNGHEIA